MYNSIIEFIEKDTTKIEKFIKESLLSGNMMRFEEELLDTVLEFGRSLYQGELYVAAGPEHGPSFQPEGRTVIMASMYSAKVMEHFANPHNVGEIPDANGVGEVGNPKCGDIMRMYLKIENNVIVDVKFLTFGCGAAIATSSMATDLIKGKTIDEALKLTNKAVVEALEGLPPIKVHCSVLAEQAVKAALSDYYRRQGIDPEPIVGKLEEDCDHCESCGN